MTRCNTVLVLGTEERSDLIETLFDLGYVPIRRDGMMQALDRIRHEQFDAVFVDRERTDVDALEFVLNVRDLEPELPVVVVGQIDDLQQRRALTAQDELYCLNASADLKRTIQRILN